MADHDETMTKTGPDEGMTDEEMTDEEAAERMRVGGREKDTRPKGPMSPKNEPPHNDRPVGPMSPNQT